MRRLPLCLATLSIFAVLSGLPVRAEKFPVNDPDLRNAQPAALRHAEPAAATAPALRKAMSRQQITFFPAAGAGGKNSFQSRMPGYAIDLDAAGMTIQTQRRIAKAPAVRAEAFDGGARMPIDTVEVERRQMHLDFVGANKDARLEGLDATPARVNSFVGSDPARWQHNLPTYSRVRYTDLYPGVDLIYYGQKQNTVEYDLVVSPHADVSRIRFRVSGDQQASIDGDGNLCLDGRDGGVRLARPVLYQDEKNGKKLIVGGFVELAKNEFGFRPVSYDADKPLIIDPQINLVYATYAGGIHNDEAFDMALDAAGSAYVVGHSASQDFPVTGNAVQLTRQTIGQYSYDAVMMKFDASGTLVYSTFLGGTNNDQANGVVVNADGSVYVGGGTSSADFPVTPGAFQKTSGGSSDAFLVRLSNDGSQLLYSTYLGGAGDESITKVLLNADGSLWLGGSASAAGLPVSSTAFQTKPGSADNLFVAKALFNSAGALQLPYLTFIGGTTASQENSIADLTTDAAGNIYLGGGTNSSDYPVTSNAYEKPFPLSNGCYNSATPNSIGVLTKFSPDLSQMLYSTVLGGHIEDQQGYPVCNQFVRTVHVDAQGNMWLLGTVGMQDFPTTSNAISKQLNGNGLAGVDNFVSELSADGTQLLYSTYLGGSQFDYGARGLWDANNNIWIVSNTQSTDYPVTSNALQATNGGGYDTELTELSPDGTKILYATYLGGNGDDDINGNPQIHFDSQGNIHLSGSTGSSNYPVTATAAQAQLANGDQGPDGTDFYYTILGSGAISTVGPVIGGNLGDTTLSLQGAGFQSGATCQIALNDKTITATTSTVSTNGTGITCTFALGGVGTGVYDVTVANPNGGATFTKQGGFTVQNATGPNVWVNVTGRSAIRFNTPTSFVISYGNTGDTDAVGVPIMVSVPQGVTLSAVSPLSKFPAVALLDQSTIPTIVPLNGSNVLPLFIPRIAAGGSASFIIQLTAPTTATSFSISAYSWNPFGTSVADVTSALGTYQNGDFTQTRSLFDPQKSLANAVQESIRPMASGGGFNSGAAAKCIQDLTLLGLQIAGQVFPPALELQCGAQLAAYLGSAVTTVINSQQPGYSSGDAGSDLSGLYANGGQAAISCFKALAGSTPAGIAANTILALIQASLNGASAIKDCQDAAKPQNPQKSPIGGVGAVDPNDKTGPAGDGSASHFVTGTKAFTYNVEFENKAAATAPVSQAVVTDQLDPTKVDLSTLTLGTIQFGTTTVNLPAGTNFYNTTLKLSASLNLRIAASLDQNSGLLKWTFTSLDPSTGLPPTDPTVGFLPPDTDGIMGQASVLFNVTPKAGQTTGTAISNTASVVFDSNASLSTPTWLNTLDVDAPTSSVTALPAVQTTTAATTTFTVSWSGTDKGAGITSYDIYASDNGSAFTVWQSGVTAQSASFIGTGGHTYGFYSIATDGAGNVETAKTTADTSTKITTQVATSTALVASATSAVAGTGISFTATTTPASGSGVPTGTMTFRDGASTTLGTVTLDATGKAAFSTSTLAVGVHTITASYGGDANYLASTSTSSMVTITAIPADFSLGLGAASGTITAGSTGTVSVTLTPSGGFTSAIALTCSGLPSNTKCSFTPASVTPVTGAATSVMTITTNTTSAALEPLPGSRTGRLAFAVLIGGGLLGLGFLRGRRRLTLPIGLLSLLLAAGIVGCGGASTASTTTTTTTTPTTPVTPKGTYPVIVTGTAGSTTHTASYSLTIQ